MTNFLFRLITIIVGNLIVVTPSVAIVIDTTYVSVSEDTKQKVKNELSYQSSAAYAAYVDWHTPKTSSYSNCDAVINVVRMYQEELGKGCGGLDGLIYTQTECNEYRYKRYQEEVRLAEYQGCM